MISLTSFVNESNSKLQKLSDRLNKNNERIEKIQLAIEKKQKKFSSLISSYSKDEELLQYIPLEVFDNFKYITYAQEREKAKELGRQNLSCPYNIECGDLYRLKSQEVHEKYDNDWDKIKEDPQYKAMNRFYWDYLTVATELIQSIGEKERDIRDLNNKNAELMNAIGNISDNDTKVEELFDKIPELKQFIETAGEKQIQFLKEQNEKTVEAYKKYKKAMSEFTAKYGSSISAKDNEAMTALRNCEKMKPTKSILSDDNIERMVNDWKRSESTLLASKLTGEFGDIKNTYLTIGADGNVNGTIQGTLKTAKIETIFAGGYNIQCLHTRLLINEK